MKIHRVVLSAVIPLVLLSLLLLPGNARAQEYAYYEDFEDGLAQDWTLDPDWQVIQDEGNYVLSGQGHNWARPAQLYDDYRLTFRLKVLSGQVHLNFRMSDTGRYFIGFNAQGSQLNKQYWPDTFLNDLARKSQRYTENEWHQIEIVGQGDTLTFIVDGITEWTYTDPEPILVGGFAFEALDGSQIYIDDIKAELAASSAFHVDQTIAALTWTRTGGPLGGLGYDIRMMPGNPDSMLVSDAYAGVFASTDGGMNWLPSNIGITVRTGGTGDAIPIFCLTIDPTQSNIVWIGTQNMRGIFKSIDGGATWIKKDQGVIESDGLTFRGITVDPTNSDIVYAAAELSSWAWNQGLPRSGREFDMSGGVVYKTHDGGESWTEVWRGDSLARYIWIDPRDTNVLYVSTGIFDREAANSDPKTGDPGGEGVIKSTDGGKTWANINNGLKNLYVGSLFMHPINPDILIAGAGNISYQEHTGVYRSTNGGLTWEQTLNTNGESIESVEISTSNPEIVYAGGNSSIYRSEDGGQTWKRVSGGGKNGWGSPGVRAGFPIDFQVDPRNPDRIFANEYGGGNFLSEDGGKTWVDASRGYTGALVRALAVDPNEPGRVIAAARSGIFISYDGGSNWIGLSYPPVVSMEWNAVAIDPTNPQNIVSETNWENLLVNSRDGGMTWNYVLVDFRGQRVGWHAIVFAPSDPNIVYAGSTGFFSAGTFDSSQPAKGIYSSLDGGENWKPANNELTQNASVFGLAVDMQNPQVVFAATSNHGLLKTTDGGQNWYTVQGGLPQTGANTVSISPVDANIILTGFERKALYLSEDGGQTWKPSALGMNPEAQITSVVFDPAGSGMVVYAADFFGGVYRSSDGGRKWAAINNGLLMRSVNTLAISSDGLHLYAGTEGGGTYRLDLNNKIPATAPIPTAVPVSTNGATETHIATSTPILSTATLKSALNPIYVGGAIVLLIGFVAFALWKRKSKSE